MYLARHSVLSFHETKHDNAELKTQCSINKQQENLQMVQNSLTQSIQFSTGNVKN